MKKALIFMFLALLIFTGCQDRTPEPATAESSITATENMTVEPTLPPTNPTEFSFQPVTEATEPEVTEKATEPPQTAQPPTQQKESTESAAEETAPKTTPTEPSVQETKPVVTEPEETQPPSSQPVTEDEEDIPETTAPVETAPPEPEPEAEPEPFDIASWVSFAQSYAQSIGLNLDSSAVDCWDNPITAGSHCIYLERDIRNRLDRCHADEDITDVWIWAVDVGNGCYDLYIGYA